MLINGQVIAALTGIMGALVGGVECRVEAGSCRKARRDRPII